MTCIVRFGKMDGIGKIALKEWGGGWIRFSPVEEGGGLNIRLWSYDE